MAREFTESPSKYLIVSGAPVSAVPLTMGCWFYSLNDANTQTLMCIANNTAANVFRLEIKGEVAGDPVRAGTSAAGSSTQADTTSGYSTSTWHHGCGIFTAIDNRSVLIDGGSKGTDTNSKTPSGLNETLISRVRWGVELYASMIGRIAEAAIWNAALTDAEVAMLAAGYTPPMVRPQSLVFYVPLVRDNDEDIVGGLSMTANGSPTVATHPPIIYPAPPIFYSIPSAAPADALPMAMNHYRRLRT